MAHPDPIRARRRWYQRGFTLIELMIVVALVMILTAIGIGLSDDLIPRFRTRHAAKTFASKVNECRALAIRSGKECSVWLLAADSSLTNLDSNDGEYWVGLGNKNRDSTTWDYLPVDTESGGADLDQTQGIVDIGDTTGQFYQRRVGISQWSSLGGPGTGNSDRIVFGPRGFVTNPSSDFGALGTIDVNFVNKVARAAGFTEDWTVKISRTGMTRIDTTAQSEYGGLRSGTAEASSTP
ncbi:MAG: prepilin-type N-terminal cleavage/methylation domain-containing protein [Myxococcota bacterium]|nr:prepilin-type N-terminal cleavage/methylation domain-containing protein [Myxococcota bacterium]